MGQQIPVIDKCSNRPHHTCLHRLTSYSCWSPSVVLGYRGCWPASICLFKASPLGPPARSTNVGNRSSESEDDRAGLDDAWPVRHHRGAHAAVAAAAATPRAAEAHSVDGDDRIGRPTTSALRRPNRRSDISRGRKTWSHRLRLAGWWQQYSPVGPRAHLVAPRGHEIAVFPYMPSTPKRAEAGAGRAPAEVITPVYRS